MRSLPARRCRDFAMCRNVGKHGTRNGVGGALARIVHRTPTMAENVFRFPAPTARAHGVAHRRRRGKRGAMRPLSWLPATRPRRLAVVLSGGANLGAFQVGVIDVLARAGLAPDLLVGTSVGAFNAAFWAFQPGPDVGRKLAEVWLGMSGSVVLGGHPLLALPRLLRGHHLFADAGLVRLLRTTLPPAARVEDATHPLGIVVTRALEGTREVIRSGPLESALLASSAIPGLFPPVSIDGTSYVDGGLVANCDLQAVVEAGIGQAVAVDVMAGGFDTPATDILESATRAITFMIARQTDMAIRLWGPRMRLAVVRARLAISARVDNFTHTQALIDLGRSAGERLLAEHLDSRWRVRPGILELSGTLATPPAGAGAEEVSTDEVPARAEPPSPV
jgi:NTE family protein